MVIQSGTNNVLELNSSKTAGVYMLIVVLLEKTNALTKIFPLQADNVAKISHIVIQRMTTVV